MKTNKIIETDILSVTLVFTQSWNVSATNQTEILVFLGRIGFANSHCFGRSCKGHHQYRNMEYGTILLRIPTQSYRKGGD